MHTSKPAKKIFSAMSCVALAGAVVAFAPAAQAACPDTEAPTKPIDIPVSKAAVKACTPADLAVVNAELGKQGATFATLETAVKAQSATCAACIFSKDSDTNWGPIVSGNQGSAWNGEACYQNAPGGSAGCEAAVLNSQACSGWYCFQDPGYCTTEAAAKACAVQVSTDPATCGNFNVTKACGGDANLAAIENACKTGAELIALSCGAGATTPTDGGTTPTDGGTTVKDGGSTVKDSGTTTKDSGTTKKDSGSGDDDDDDTGEDSGKSSSGSGAKKDSGASTGNNADEIIPNDDSGCAQNGSGSGGSIASALVIAAAVAGAASRRRRNAKR